MNFQEWLDEIRTIKVYVLEPMPRLTEETTTAYYRSIAELLQRHANKCTVEIHDDSISITKASVGLRKIEL